MVDLAFIILALVVIAGAIASRWVYVREDVIRIPEVRPVPVLDSYEVWREARRTTAPPR